MRFGNDGKKNSTMSGIRLGKLALTAILLASFTIMAPLAAHAERDEQNSFWQRMKAKRDGGSSSSASLPATTTSNVSGNKGGKAVTKTEIFADRSVTPMVSTNSSGAMTNAIARYQDIAAQGGWGAGESEETPPSEHVASVARVMDAVLGEIGDAAGLIIDLRVNSGGYDAVSLEIASRFADVERVAWRKKDAASAPYDVRVAPGGDRRYRGPIAVLIGPNTVSAGESMAESLAVLPQARLIGQPTAGAWSDAIPKTLPNGWTYTLSVESAYTPEGRLLEGSGVEPDERTPEAEDASGQALWGRDIAVAEAWLKSIVH